MNAKIPSRNATSIVILRKAPSVLQEDYQVLLIQRNAAGSFGNMWVFPGGVQQPSDFQSQSKQLPSLKPAEVTRRMTGIRQTYQEVGLPILEDKIDSQTLQQIRPKCHNFTQFLKLTQNTPDFQALVPLVRIITPYFPVLKRRFDTSFYLYCLKDSELSTTLKLQTDEVKSAQWQSPTAILSHIQKGKKLVLTPQWMIIQFLSRFSSLQSLNQFAQQQLRMSQYARYPIVSFFHDHHLKQFMKGWPAKPKSKSRTAVQEIFPGDQEYVTDEYDYFFEVDPKRIKFSSSKKMRNRLYMKEDLVLVDKHQIRTTFPHPFFRVLQMPKKIKPKL